MVARWNPGQHPVGSKPLNEEMPGQTNNLARQHDPDRALAAVFAPDERREHLFTLIAFNHELARARQVASQPPIALIRLQWWREVVEGAERRHPVATPLRSMLRDGVIEPDDLLPLIEAREVEAEPAIPSLAEWRDYLLSTSGGLAVACARILQADAALLPIVRQAGAAYGAADLLRMAPILATRGRCLLPEDVLARHGLRADSVTPESLGPARAALAAIAGQWLLDVRAMRWPATIRAAVLPAVLARRDLRRLPPPGPRGLTDRLAVIAAGLTGRL